MGLVIKGDKLGYGTCLVLIVVAAFVIGCGSGSSDKSEIESTLTGYLNDFVTGNGKGACEAMTGPELRKIIERAADSEPAMGSLSCPEVMTRVSEDLGASAKEALENIEISEVKVNGNTATAEIGSGAGPARFEKIDGSWYIAGGKLRLQTIH